MKANKKKTSYVVDSHMSDKSIKKEVQTLKEQIWHIQHPKNQNAEAIAINLYNSMIIGIHNYYRLATNVNLDCAKIATVSRGYQIAFRCNKF